MAASFTATIYPEYAMREALLAAFRRRHACHHFETGRAVVATDLDYILEAGRLSPSSFGLEQWHFVVCTGQADKTALAAACFGQPQVGQAAAVIVILAKIAELDPDSPYAQKLLRREYPGAAFANGLAMYREFHASTDVTAWSITQCHIAAANMMTAAAAIGLDTCPIGGFNPAAVSKILGVNPGQAHIALLLPVGHCGEAAPEKQRLPLTELTTRR